MNNINVNYFEQGHNFIKSVQNLFVQPSWMNQLHVMSPGCSVYSPMSSSCASFSSPIKSDTSDQEEPLNLSLKETSKPYRFPASSSCSSVSSVHFNRSMTMPAMTLFMPPMFQALFSRNMAPNSVKQEHQSTSNKQPRLTAVKIKKSRAFKCNQCQTSFSCLSTLTQHTLDQHGGYKCHICDTNFTQRSNLQRHALRHVGFKPYKCNVCCKEYYRKDHLIRHISFNHPTVSPKENIIQRLSSSESLNFIDDQNFVLQSVKRSPSSHSSTHSCHTPVPEDDQSLGEDNVFLCSDIKDEEMTVDVLN